MFVPSFLLIKKILLERLGPLLQSFDVGPFYFPPHLLTKGENKTTLLKFTERILHYLKTSKGNTHGYDYKVSLVTTPCNLGGIRYWFACPTCFGRVGVIYLAPGNVHFMCRHCNNLSYHSRNESSPLGILGVTDRKMKKLQSEIKRWTWRGRPTRKVRRLYKLQRKMGMLSPQMSARLERFKARLS